MSMLRSLPAVTLALAALAALHCGTTTTSVGGLGDAGAASDGASKSDSVLSEDGAGQCCSLEGAATGCKSLGGAKGPQGKCEEVCNVGSTYDFQMVAVNGCPGWTYKVRPGSFACGNSD